MNTLDMGYLALAVGLLTTLGNVWIAFRKPSAMAVIIVSLQQELLRLQDRVNTLETEKALLLQQQNRAHMYERRTDSPGEVTQ